jgi:hypothetical protein
LQPPYKFPAPLEGGQWFAQRDIVDDGIPPRQAGLYSHFTRFTTSTKVQRDIVDDGTPPRQAGLYSHFTRFTST